MNGTSKVTRRRFIRSAAAVTASGAASCATVTSEGSGDYAIPTHNPIRIGIAGWGPFSRAQAYIRAINNPSFPPRTNMRVTAVWGNVGSADLDGVSRATSPGELRSQVDGVFITDPENSLSLAAPFITEGTPVFVDPPFARSLAEARDLVELAMEHGCVLCGGSNIPWMSGFQAMAAQIDPVAVQQYYAAGTGINNVTDLADILETTQKLVGGRIANCAAYGMQNTVESDLYGMSPVMVHLQHEHLTPDRDPVLGVVSNWYGEPYSDWARVHSDRDVIEQGVFCAGDRANYDDDEYRWLPLLRMVGKSFASGEWPESGDYLLEKVRTMLMVRTSGNEGGRVVYREEVGM